MTQPKPRKTHELRTAAIRLRDEHGLTARDIAQMLGCNERQVANWLERFRTPLRQGDITMKKMIESGSDEETRILNELVKDIFVELGIPARRWREASDSQAQEFLDILISRCPSVGIDAFSLLRQSLLDDAENYRQQGMNEEAERCERLASIPRRTN